MLFISPLKDSWYSIGRNTIARFERVSNQEKEYYPNHCIILLQKIKLVLFNHLSGFNVSKPSIFSHLAIEKSHADKRRCSHKKKLDSEPDLPEVTFIMVGKGKQTESKEWYFSDVELPRCIPAYLNQCRCNQSISL